MDRHDTFGQATFISYARDDDEAFVRRLHADLTRRGVSVWWDRAAMESRGQTFLQVIRDAIAGDCARLLLVVGPRAVASDYVRYEWEHALRHCKVIVPIVRSGDPQLIPVEIKNAGFNLIPRELALYHSPDFRSDERYHDALEELVRILTSPILPPGALKGVQWTAAHYVPRPEYLEQLQDTVLRDVAGPTVIASAQQTTALQGMGGIGKSVLAAAFARACFTRRAFTDGVIWLTCGRQEPHREDVALAVLRRAGAALGDSEGHYADVEPATGRMTDLLADRTCLIVLDDVWEMAHAFPFVKAAQDTRSRVLVTTRDAGLARRLGAFQCEVDVLGPGPALELLAKASATERDRLPPVATEVAAQCGYLPLALAMVGAMVAARPADRWNDALAHLRAADLDRIRHDFPDYAGKPNLLVAMQVSVDALPRTLRERYFDLAVFAEDERIPEAVFSTFWTPLGVDAAASREMLDTFVDRSLLRRDQQHLLSLHDIQHDYVRTLAPDLQQARRRLLDAYRVACLPGDWPDGPDDGYFLQHLVDHLLAAGHDAEVHRLLAIGGDRGNAWYRARESAGQLTGYIEDVNRAFRLVSSETASAPAAEANRVALQVRYGLMRASVAAIGRTVPVAVLAALYRHGLESASRLLDRAESLPDQDAAHLYRKLETLWTVGDVLAEPHRSRAFQIALEVVRRAIASGRFPAERIATPLLGVIRHMPAGTVADAATLAESFRDEHRDELRAMLVVRYAETGDGRRGLDLIARIADVSIRARAIEAALVVVDADHLEEAALVAQGLPLPYRAAVVPALARRYAAAGCVAEAVDLARRTTGNPEFAAAAIHGIAEHLDPETAATALHVARTLPRNTVRRASAMARVALRLAEERRAVELDAIWRHEVARGDKDGEEAMRLLVAELPRDTLRAAGYRFELRGDLRVPYVERLAALGDLEEALKIAAVCPEPERAAMFEHIAPHVTADVVDRVLARVEALTDENRREAVLQRVLPRVAAVGRWRDALGRALEMTPFWRQRALEEMVPHLDAAGVQVAAQRLSRLDDAEQQLEARRRCAACAPTEMTPEFIAAHGHAIPSAHRDAVLDHVAGRYPEYLPDVRRAMAGIEDVRDRALSLLSLARHLLDHEVEEVVRWWLTQPASAHGALDHVERVTPLFARLSPDLRRSARRRCLELVQRGFDEALENEFDSSVASWAAALGRLGRAETALDAIQAADGTSEARAWHLFKATAAVQPFLGPAAAAALLHDLLAQVRAASNPYDPLIALGHVDELAGPLVAALVDLLNSGACEVRHALTETSTLVGALARHGHLNAAFSLAAELRPHSRGLYVRALAAVAALASIDAASRLEAVTAASDAVVRLTNPVNNIHDRSAHLADLVPSLMRLTDEELRPLWTTLIQELARYPRPEFLLDLAALAPIAGRMAGGAGLRAVCDGMACAATWWP